jgi:hypothetical protein
MAVTFQCDECGLTSSDVTGWTIVSVQFLHNDPTVPTPPGGRMLDATADDKLFHQASCRDAWCAKASVTVPVSLAR